MEEHQTAVKAGACVTETQPYVLVGWTDRLERWEVHTGREEGGRRKTRINMNRRVRRGRSFCRNRYGALMMFWAENATEIACA